MMIFDSKSRNMRSATSNHCSSRGIQTSGESQFTLEKFTKPVDEWIGRNPALGAGLALVLGMTIGCLVKRR